MSTSTTFSIKGKTKRFYITLASLMSVFVLTFIFAFIASSVFAPVNITDAESVTFNINNTGYYVTTVANDIALDLNATPDGAMAVAKDTITTKTNCPGYKLFLSSATTSPATTIGGVSIPTNSLILEDSTAQSGDYLLATSGTFAAPAVLDTNSWGFAVPSGSIGLPASAGAFDASYGTTADGNLDPTNKFAKISLYAAPQLVQETSTANETGVELDVYFGVKANMQKTSGAYSADVLYTAISEVTSSEASVSPSIVYDISGGTTLTITTPLYTSMLLDASDANVTIGDTTCPVTSVGTNPATNLLTVQCTAPAKAIGTYNVAINLTRFAQSYTITNGVSYSLGGTQITDLASSYATSHPDVTPALLDSQTPSITEDTITITTDVTAPGITASDVTISLTGISSGATSGSTSCPVTSVSYDDTSGTSYLVVNCTKPSTLEVGTYAVTLTSHGITIPAATTSANTLTVIPKFYAIANMQDMTAEICNSVKTPNNATGANVTLVSSADDYVTIYGITTDGTPNVPQRVLYDIRGADGTGTSLNPVAASSANARSYKIRKLADGNCWMSEELYLPLAVGTGVEASKNDGSTFTYTPTSNASIGTNTRTYTWNSTERWYYNWYAATGEKGTSSTAANVDVDGSICPVGWKLPSNYTVTGTNLDTGTNWSDMSWNSIVDTYGISTTPGQASISTSTGYQTLEASPISLVRAGYYGSGSFYYGGSSGFFWSSTANSTSNAYYLYYYSSYVLPQYHHDKGTIGFTVRCLAVR